MNNLGSAAMSAAREGSRSKEEVNSFMMKRLRMVRAKASVKYWSLIGDESMHDRKERRVRKEDMMLVRETQELSSGIGFARNWSAKKLWTWSEWELGFGEGEMANVWSGKSI